MAVISAEILQQLEQNQLPESIRSCAEILAENSGLLG